MTEKKCWRVCTEVGKLQLSFPEAVIVQKKESSQVMMSQEIFPQT